MQQLMEVLGLNESIDDAKLHDEDDWLIELLSLRMLAEEVISDLSNH